jgi:hypothetical protein
MKNLKDFHSRYRAIEPGIKAKPPLPQRRMAADCYAF